MSENDTHTTDELSAVEVTGVILARVIALPVIILGLVALVTLNTAETLARVPKISDAEVTESVATFPEPIHIGIFVVCAILLLYGHFYTDVPVWEIVTRQRTYPEESSREDMEKNQ